MYTSDASLISESDSGELTRGSSSGYLTSGPEDEYESGPSEGDGGAMAMASEPICTTVFTRTDSAAA